jgi:hypothetical protein
VAGMLGTVLLLSSNRNEPLGMRHQPHRTSTSSITSSYRPSRSNSRTRSAVPTQKKTADGQFVLDPQPDDSVNDPLNWPVWQRDAALVSLGFYCLMGGGMTPILAAGFNDVAAAYDVSTQQVAFTTGFYMLGLGLGSVVMSPTAILYGKRPVYLLGATLFVVSAVWCAASPKSRGRSYFPRACRKPSRVSSICYNCGDLLLARTSLSSGNIHTLTTRWKEPDPLSECRHH